MSILPRIGGVALAWLLTGCHPHGRAEPEAPEVDPLDLAVAPRTGIEAILLRNGVIKARPDGIDVVAEPRDDWAPDDEFHVNVENTDTSGWTRVIVEQPYVRIAMWVPSLDVGPLPVAVLNDQEFGSRSYHGTFKWSLIGTGSSVFLPRGTRLLDRPGGIAFGVTTEDTSLRWYGEREAHAQVQFSSPWGELNAWVACPCEVTRPTCIG